MTSNPESKIFSPLAHLDPNFLLKKQQHEARRTTRHSGHVVTSSGLPNTLVRKRRPEVSHISDTSYPKAGYSDNLLIRLIRTIRELLIHLLASPREHNIHLSKLFLGEHIKLTLYTLCLLTNLYVRPFQSQGQTQQKCQVE